MSGDLRRGKLLVVTTIPLTVDSFLLPHIAEWRARGWEVRVGSGEAAEGIDVVVPMTRRLADRRNLAAVAGWHHWLRSAQADVVVVTTPIAAAILRLAASLPGSRAAVVYLAQGLHFGRPLRPGQFPYFVAERLLAPATHTLVTIAAEDEAEVRRWRFLRPRGAARIHGIGVPAIPFMMPSAPQSPYRIGFLGELNANKRPWLVVEGAAVAGEGLGCKVVVEIAGAGDSQPVVEGAAARLDVDTIFHGWIDDPVSWLRGIDVLVLPSMREGIPRCLLEAMSAGVPCVSTDTRGARELLSGERGWIVPPTPRGIASALVEVYEWPDEVGRRVAAAADFAQEYRLDRAVRDLSTVVDVAGSDRPVGRR